MSNATTVHGRPRIGEAGAAADLLRHRPDTTSRPGRPHISLLELDHGPWQLLGGSARGVLHSRRGEPCQDHVGVVLVDETLYSVVCDGVGEFDRSHEAAEHVVTMVLAAVADGAEVAAVLEQANLDLQAMAADGRGRVATTVLVSATRATRPGWLTVDLWWIGDTSAWSLADGEWTCLTPGPAPTSPLYSTKADALPRQSVRLQQLSVSLRSDAVFYMSDGVGAPLEDIDEVRDTLAGWWASKPTIFEFAAQLSFARRGHMDDRSVVGIWPVSFADVAVDEGADVPADDSADDSADAARESVLVAVQPVAAEVG